MRALLVEVDFKTGKRAGDVNPRDPKLQCYGWQDLESNPGREIRIVEDDRDLSQYKGVKGVTILDGEKAINTAIQQLETERASDTDLYSEYLMVEAMKEKGLPMSALAGKSKKEVVDYGVLNNLAGVRVTRKEMPRLSAGKVVMLIEKVK